MEQCIKPAAPILLVDDDQDYRAMLRCHLEELGYQVLEAEDGAQACRLAAQCSPLLIILDIVMPNAEGLETISRLRQKRIPAKILAVSGTFNANEYLLMAVLMGAAAKIEKTRPVRELLRMVQLLAGQTTPAPAAP